MSDGQARKLTAADPATLGGLGGESARERALRGLEAAVPKALAVVMAGLAVPSVPRNEQHKYALARYVLDVVLDRAPVEQPTAAPTNAPKPSTEDVVRALRGRLGVK